jgi:predicted GIY-YIG superfamily endonuclease
MSFVYILFSTTGKTYVGATKYLDRRLRQHNGELVGGAKATSKVKGTWKRICYVSGFPDWRSTLQFEWKVKNVSRKHKGTQLEKRIKSLYTIIESGKSTANSIPFSVWDVKPCIHWEDEEDKKKYESVLYKTNESSTDTYLETHCTHIYRYGKHVGEYCTRSSIKDTNLCKVHHKVYSKNNDSL